MPHFIHLHLHTEYSLVDSLIRVKPLVKAVRDAGMPACAITDKNNLFALVKFYRAAQSEGIKPIIGVDVEIYDANDSTSRLVLLCQNQLGYRHLTQLVSNCYTKGQKNGVPYLDRNWLTKEMTEGLIALSGGRGGDIGQALLAGHTNLARQQLDRWNLLFPQRFYLELQRTGRPNEEEYIHAAIELALETGTPVVATNDVCFLKAEDFDAHEIRVCIHDGKTLTDKNRPQHHSPQQYLRTPQEMAELFADIPEALENTWLIAQRCNLELTLGKNFLPDFPDIPKEESVEDYFRRKAQSGLEQRLVTLFDKNSEEFQTQRQPYDERLALELNVIIQMGFPGYFLIVSDFIQWAKENNIPVGPGRGSGAGSLVAYALQITDLDPLRYKLLFERFLNPERVSMPDFDIDFCMEGRDDVINYVAKRYGRERVSQIITYGSMAAKAVIRDVGRVLNHPYGFVDKIAKLVPFELGITLDKALKKEEELQNRYDQEEDVHTLIDMARKLEGLTRNPGKHAGGVVIAPTVLTDFTPLYCEADGSDLMTQFDKGDVEAVGLVKFDFLGLRTLTIIKWALNMLKDSADKNIDIAKIPLDDPETYDLLKRAETTAVFQLESSGIKKLIRDLRPDCFDDLVALVALYRPGPLQSGMVDDFIERKRGAKFEYPHPALAPILKSTYGVIVYQEQVMQIAQVLAGYTLGGADILRRCLSGSTKVVDAMTGRLFTLHEIASHLSYWIGRKVFCLDLKTKKITQQPITAIYPNGVQDVWEITTKTHRKIKATHDHLFYTLLGWKPLSAFKVGDRIGLAKQLPITHTSDISDAQIKLIAYLIGDGHLCPDKLYSSYFCNSNPELIADFNQCAEELFGTDAPIDYQHHVGRKSVAYARIGRISAFKTWIDDHIKRAYSRDKQIPSWVFSLSKAQLQLFLAILWSTDGSFDTKIGHADYTSTSIILVKQIQHLLLRIGIVALFNTKKTTYKQKTHVSYRVQVTGREDMLKFCEWIQPLLSEEKREKAQKCYVVVKDKLRNQSKHTIPAEVITLIADAKYASGMTWARIDQAVGAKKGTMASGLNFHKPPTRRFARHRVRNFAIALQNQELMQIAESEVFWDDIISIKYVGKEEVFDLSIPETHNFVANDFIVHNCMGKKNPAEMAEQRTVFTKGAIERGVDKQKSTYIFDLMEKFAAYGFNLSHSAAYALLAYQTAWLKAHYPAAFMAAVLSADMDNTDKIVSLIEECRHGMRLKVLSPNINTSDYKFTVLADDNRIIRYGLGAIRGAGEAALEGVIEERQTKGKFKDLFDLCKRINLRKVSRRVLEPLIKSGALDELGPNSTQIGFNRAVMMASLENAIKEAERYSNEKKSGQNDIFAMFNSTQTKPQEKAPPFVQPAKSWNKTEQLNGEKESLGFYLSGHPVKPYENELVQLNCKRLADIKPTEKNQTIRAGGWVTEVRTTHNKRGKMGFITLDDSMGRLDIKIYAEVYETVQAILAKDTLLIAEGEVRMDDYTGGYAMTANKIFTLASARETYARCLELKISNQQAASSDLAPKLKNALMPHCQGRCMIKIHYHYQDSEQNSQVELQLGDNWRVKPSVDLVNQLIDLLGDETIKITY